MKMVKISWGCNPDTSCMKWPCINSVLCTIHVYCLYTMLHLHELTYTLTAEAKHSLSLCLTCLWCLQRIKQCLWSKPRATVPFYPVHVAIHWPRNSPSKSAAAAVWERPGARPVRGAHYLTQVHHAPNFQSFSPWHNKTKKICKCSQVLVLQLCNINTVNTIPTDFSTEREPILQRETSDVKHTK